MNRRFVSFMVYGVIGLAVIGVISALTKNPGDFFRQLLWLGITVTILYFAIRFFTRGRQVDSSYSRAAKQSKRKYEDKTISFNSRAKKEKNAKKLMKPTALKRASGTHLTVIEGKKGKKRKSALF